MGEDKDFCLFRIIEAAQVHLFRGNLYYPEKAKEGSLRRQVKRVKSGKKRDLAETEHTSCKVFSAVIFQESAD